MDHLYDNDHQQGATTKRRHDNLCYNPTESRKMLKCHENVLLNYMNMYEWHLLNTAIGYLSSLPDVIIVGLSSLQLYVCTHCYCSYCPYGMLDWVNLYGWKSFRFPLGYEPARLQIFDSSCFLLSFFVFRKIPFNCFRSLL